MARILLFLMKCILGLLATLGLLLVVAVIGGWLFWQQLAEWRTADHDALPDRIVLKLDLAEGLRDGPAEGPLALVGFDTTPSFRDLAQTLEAAATDERVAGIVLRLGYGNLSAAQAQELRSILMRFRDGERFVLGFAEAFGEAGDGNEHYHLATASNEVWLQPSGTLDLIGYQLQQPFLRDLLEEWDITLRGDQRQQWKDLIDTAVRDELSPPVRENLQAVVDSLYEQLATAVAEGRGLTPAEARRRIDSGPYSAPEALEAGLVDRLGYRADFEKAALELAGEGADFLDVLDYLDSLPEEEGSESRIALLHLQGAIQLGGGSDPLGTTSAGMEKVVDSLRAAADDAEIAAIVLRIDSPGGSAVASDMVWHEIRRIREEGKPVVISLGSIAASGGYYIAVAGHPLLAQPGTLTGSVGVAGGKPVLEDFWPHLGLTWDGVQAGPNADIWSLNSDFSPQQWRKFQSYLDQTFEDFTRKVSEGRELEGEALEAVIGGRIFTGEQALEAGLVDALGGLPEAAAAAAEAVGLDPDAGYRLVDYPEAGAGYEQLMNLVLEQAPGTQASLEGLLALTHRLAPLVEALNGLTADPRQKLLQAPEVGTR